MTPVCLGRPTIDGKTALGASSPANPALHIPDPLSTTNACTSVPIILISTYKMIEESEVIPRTCCCRRQGEEKKENKG